MRKEPSLRQRGCIGQGLSQRGSVFILEVKSEVCQLSLFLPKG